MSAPEPNPFDGLEKSAFDAVAWPSLIAALPVKECHEYAKPLAERAQVLEDAKSVEPARAARVLGTIASFGFHPGESDHPFHPLMVWDGKRSPLPEDFLPK